jgi:hypothetical protein
MCLRGFSKNIRFSFVQGVAQNLPQILPYWCRMKKSLGKCIWCITYTSNGKTSRKLARMTVKIDHVKPGQAGKLKAEMPLATVVSGVGPGFQFVQGLIISRPDFRQTPAINETGPVFNQVGRGADCFTMKPPQRINRTKWPTIVPNWHKGHPQIS